MQQGEKLAIMYQEETLESLLEKLQLKVVYFQGRDVERYILGYYEEHTIYINKNQTEKIQPMIEEDINHLVIAHEIFHHLETMYPNMTGYDSESNAHLFVEKFLDLDYNPLIIQGLLKNLNND